jgi:hypothetical protein
LSENTQIFYSEGTEQGGYGLNCAYLDEIDKGSNIVFGVIQIKNDHKHPPDIYFVHLVYVPRLATYTHSLGSTF